MASAKNAGAALNPVGNGHPLSEANRINVSITAIRIAMTICRFFPRTTVP